MFNKPKSPLAARKLLGVFERPVVEMARRIQSSIKEPFKLHTLLAENSLNPRLCGPTSNSVNGLVINVGSLFGFRQELRIIRVRAFGFQNQMVTTLTRFTQGPLWCLQMIQHSKVNNNVIMLFGRKSLVQIVSDCFQTWIALNQHSGVVFPPFNARDFGAEHGKEMANITMTGTQLQKRLSIKELMAVVIEDHLNAFCAPFLIPALKMRLKLARELFKLIASVVFNSCAHFLSIRP